MAQLHRNAGVRVNAAPFFSRYMAARPEFLDPRDKRSIDLAREDGDMDYWIADRLSIQVLGDHPREVFPDWDEADALLQMTVDKDYGSRPQRDETRQLINELRAQYTPPGRIDHERQGTPRARVRSGYRHLEDATA